MSKWTSKHQYSHVCVSATDILWWCSPPQDSVSFHSCSSWWCNANEDWARSYGLCVDRLWSKVKHAKLVRHQPEEVSFSFRFSFFSLTFSLDHQHHNLPSLLFTLFNFFVWSIFSFLHLLNLPLSFQLNFNLFFSFKELKEDL